MYIYAVCERVNSDSCIRHFTYEQTWNFFSHRRTVYFTHIDLLIAFHSIVPSSDRLCFLHFRFLCSELWIFVKNHAVCKLPTTFFALLFVWLFNTYIWMSVTFEISIEMLFYYWCVACEHGVSKMVDSYLIIQFIFYCNYVYDQFW